MVVDRARADKWDQKEYSALKVKFEALTREMDSLGSTYAAEEKEQETRHQLQSKQQELGLAQTDLELTKTKHTKYSKERSTLEANLKDSSRELVALEERKKKDEDQVAAIQAQCNKIEDKIFGVFLSIQCVVQSLIGPWFSANTQQR